VARADLWLNIAESAIWQEDEAKRDLKRADKAAGK
jgi:hypothetical protein